MCQKRPVYHEWRNDWYLAHSSLRFAQVSFVHFIKRDDKCVKRDPYIMSEETTGIWRIARWGLPKCLSFISQIKRELFINCKCQKTQFTRRKKLMSSILCHQFQMSKNTISNPKETYVTNLMSSIWNITRRNLHVERNWCMRENRSVLCGAELVEFAQVSFIHFTNQKRTIYQFQMSKDMIYTSKETDVCVKRDLCYVVQNSSRLPKCLSLIPHIKKDLMINFKYLKRTIVTFKKIDFCTTQTRSVLLQKTSNCSPFFHEFIKDHMCTSKETYEHVTRDPYMCQKKHIS